MSIDQLIDPRTGMPMRVYEVSQQGGLESLINPAMTDPGGEDDRAAMMAMQRDTFLPYLTGNPNAGDGSTDGGGSVEDESFTGGVATDQANPVAVTSGQAGIVPMTESQMGNLAYQDMGPMPISNAGFMDNLNYNPYSNFQANEGIGAFEYDPNIGPAANVAGDALALYTGLGYIPKFGEKFADVFSKGFSNLGDLVNKIPGVGAATSRLGDALNRGAAPIEKFMDDAVNPLGITGALLNPKAPRQEIDPSMMNTRQDVVNFMDNLSAQQVDPTVMDTQQSVQAFVDSLGSGDPPSYDGVLLGSSPYASSVTPFGVGDEAITGRWDSSLRNLPNQPGTVESGMIYDYDAPTQTFMDRAIDAMITSAGTGGGTVGSMGGGGGSIGGGGFTGGVAGGGKKTDPVDAGG